MTSGPKVLLVDDEEPLRNLVQTWLEEAGFIVFGASNGAAGLELLVEKTPDLVVTDLEMPVMGGLEFCSRVRKTSDVPILVLSGTSEEEGRTKSLRAGANEYVSKDTGLTDLLGHINDLLRSPEQERGAPGMTGGST